MKMKIRIGFFAIMLFLSLLISHSYFAVASFAAVLVHELGHMMAAKFLKIHLSECKIGIFGAALIPASADFSYKDEIILCIGGPMINILSAIAILPFYLLCYNSFLLYFILSSVSLALLNLLPVKDFDGGRILYALLCIISNSDTAERILSIFSFVTVLLLWIVSVYFLLIAQSNLSLFVFSLSLFFKIFIKEQ